MLKIERLASENHYLIFQILKPFTSLLSQFSKYFWKLFDIWVFDKIPTGMEFKKKSPHKL